MFVDLGFDLLGMRLVTLIAGDYMAKLRLDVRQSALAR